MKIIRCVTAFALVLPLSGACSRSTPQPEPSSLDRACLVAIAADPGGDDGIAKLQQDLREQRGARAAEQLGYRFVARARLSNDPGYYKVAEQAAACLESIAAGRTGRAAAARSRAAPDAPLRRGRGDRAAARDDARVRARLRPARRRADGAGPRGGGGRGLSEDDRPQAVLPVLHPRGAPALAQGRPRRRDRDDARRGQGREPARSASPSPGPTRGSRCTSCSAAAWPTRSA